MQIELKKLRFVPGHDDSHSYRAEIYINGERAFTAENDGWGGPDNYMPVPGYKGPSEQEINAWLKANKPLTGEFANLDNSLELEVGELLNKASMERENKKVISKYDRMLKTQLCGLRDGKLAAWPKKHAVNDANKEQIRKMGYVVLSGIEPRPLDFNKAPDSLYAEGLRAYCPDLWEVQTA
jgi:hypothetical protein